VPQKHGLFVRFNVEFVAKLQDIQTSIPWTVTLSWLPRVYSLQLFVGWRLWP